MPEETITDKVRFYLLYLVHGNMTIDDVIYEIDKLYRNEKQPVEGEGGGK